MLNNETDILKTRSKGQKNRQFFVSSDLNKAGNQAQKRFKIQAGNVENQKEKWQVADSMKK